MDFMTAVKTCLNKYVDFNGRAARPEYWWFVLFGWLLAIPLGIIGVISPSLGDIISIIVWLALLLPYLAAGARRLHDTDRSGWWQLLILTGIGIILLIVFWVQNGNEGANRFGPPVG